MAERPAVGDRVFATGGGSKSAITVGRIVKISQDPIHSAPYQVVCEKDGVPRWYKDVHWYKDVVGVDVHGCHTHGQGSGSERTSDSECMDVVRTDPASAGTKRKMESVELELEQVTSCRDHVRPKSQHLTMRAMGWARRKNRPRPHANKLALTPGVPLRAGAGLARRLAYHLALAQARRPGNLARPHPPAARDEEHPGERGAVRRAL